MPNIFMVAALILLLQSREAPFVRSFEPKSIDTIIIRSKFSLRETTFNSRLRLLLKAEPPLPKSLEEELDEIDDFNMDRPANIGRDKVKVLIST
jgi:hypothetical protein